MVSVLAAPVALALFALAVWMWRVDNRRLSVGAVAGVGVIVALEALAPLANVDLPLVARVILPLSVLPLAIPVLACYLIANGIRMLRRESRSFANALSLMAGVALLAVPVVTWAVLTLAAAAPRRLVWVEAVAIGFVTFVALGCLYVAGFFSLFLVYGAVYRRARVRPADAVVVLGSGLIGGRVPPLLAARLDRGVEVFDRARATGADVVLIPTGGQGADETRSEGEAMAEYLRDAGVPHERILAETEAENTEQNLRLSSAIATKHRPGARLVAVTSDYHVMRSAMLARRVGTAAAVVGARTARYFVPSATLREFIAVASMFPRTQVIAAATCVASSVLLAGVYAILRVNHGA